MEALRKFFILGTATYDRVRGKAGLRQAFDGKTVADFVYRQPGGGAVNSRLALEALAEAYGEIARVTICTKLGRDDGEYGDLKRLVLNDLHNEGMSDETIIDMAHQKDYPLPDNAISVFGHDDKVSRFIFKMFDDVKTPYDSDTDKLIVKRVKDSRDFALLNSRFPKQVMIAAAVAREAGIPALLDYSETSGDKPGMEEMLRDAADFVVLPSDADVPGMPASFKDKVKKYIDARISWLQGTGEEDQSQEEKSNFWIDNVFVSSLLYAFQNAVRQESSDRAKRLAHYMHEHFGKNFVAVSNGNQPIHGFHEGKPFELDIKNVPYFPEHDEAGNCKKKLMDNLGAGDARDAGLIFFMARGDNFLTALEKASRFATFTAQYPGRTWIAHLKKFLRADPVLKLDFPGENAPMPSLATA